MQNFLLEEERMANIIYCPEKSIFEHDSNTWLVNPVNCVGVMGKGLALEFKKRYPEMFQEYKTECYRGHITPSDCLFYPQMNIICLPTKKHWKNSSKLEYIRLGLNSILYYFAVHMEDILPCAIAFPKLGCGLGGLDWKEVHEYIRAFALLCPCETVYIHGENPNG